MKHGIRQLLFVAKWYLWIPLARIAGQLRSTRQIIFSWSASGSATGAATGTGADIQLGPRVALFMHFDGRGIVRPQVLNYIRELKANGLDVVLVSNAGKLAPEALAVLQEVCAGIILRKNIGYDFGAWRDAVDYLDLPRAQTQEVILANDSVFGPLAPLGDALRRLDYSKADIWGLTESWQVRYHLQSFFLAFGPVALRAKAWREFWDDVRPVPMKSYVVHRYEVGITQAMIKGGLSCAALWPYEALVKMVSRETLKELVGEEEQADPNKADPIQTTRRLQVLRIRDCVARRKALNPTSDLWRQLLLSGFPFIKRELLRDNPTRVEDVGDWAAVVRDTLGADPEPILQDLRLMLKGGAP